MMSQVTNLDDGTFSLEELASKIRPEDDHEPTTSLVCIENTQCATGGKALPLEWIREVARRKKIEMFVNTVDKLWLF